jgi:hypothetical protein
VEEFVDFRDFVEHRAGHSVSMETVKGIGKVKFGDDGVMCWVGEKPSGGMYSSFTTPCHANTKLGGIEVVL